MIYALALFIITLIIDLYTDLRLFYKKKKVSHGRGAALRLIGLVPAIYLMGWPAILMVGFWYWFLFDSLYNAFRGYSIWFTGSDDKDDAKSDNFLQRLKLWQHIAIKLGGVVVSTAFYLWKLFL